MFEASGRPDVDLHKLCRNADVQQQSSLQTLILMSASTCSMRSSPAAGKLLVYINQINDREFSSGAYEVWTSPSSSLAWPISL